MILGRAGTWSYDLRDRPLSVVHEDAAGTVLASVAYERDASGEPTKITREDGSYVDIDYDAAWRVEEERYHDAAGTLLETITYGYDRDGNRTSRTTAAGTETYGYLNGFELASITGPGGSEAYGTDPGGRHDSISRSGLAATFAYDSDDHITQVVVTGGPTIDYAFDAEGRRVEATSTVEGTRRYLVAPVLGEGYENPQMATDAFGNPLATWVYAGEWPLLRIDASGQPVYYLEDPMGSMLALADGTGARTARFAYDAFGIERDASGTNAFPPATLGGDFRYHGQWQDAETGLYHVRARAYDPRTGRFTSRDPVEGVFEEPESFHPYTWNANNPHTFRDPTGELSLISLSFARGIATNLRLLGGAILRFAVREAAAQVRGTAGELLIGALRLLLPSSVTDALDRTTSAFEDFVAESICGLFRGTVIERISYFEPAVLTSGQPIDNGANCAKRVKKGDEQKKGEKKRGRGKGGSESRPDMLFSTTPPEELRPGGPRSLFIGEVKYDAEDVYQKMKAGQRGSGKGKKQWPALINHAKDFSWSRTVLFTSFRGLERHKRREVVRAARKNQVLVVFVSVLRSRR